MKKLDIIFNPTSIAVIGATNKKGHVGYAFMENLVKGGFKGKTYPINLTKKKMFGIKAYPSVLDVKKKIELAIIATPAQTVPALVDECGKAGIHGVVIISAGFKARLADTLIAQACIENAVPLITRDKDFRHFQKYGGLKLL